MNLCGPSFLSSTTSRVQLILENQSVSLSITDISEQSEKDPESEAIGLLQKEAVIPFDLARGPLLRATLIRVNNHDHIFLLTLHHIVTDGLVQRDTLS
jgi:NRPS condensation-like uncharacterized protein